MISIVLTILSLKPDHSAYMLLLGHRMTSNAVVAPQLDSVK